jgi:predicted Zn-dependent protease
VRLAPDDVALLGDHAATLGELGRYKEMLAVVRRMAELDPGYPRIYFLQSVLAARAGQTDLARRLLWRAGEEAAGTPAGLVLAGVLDYRSGSPALAVEKFAELRRRQPDNPTAARLLARALLTADDHGEAIALLAPEAARPDASPYVLTLLARAYEQAGRRAEAAPLLDRAARSGAGRLAAYPLDAADRALMRGWRDDPARPEAAVVRLRFLLGEKRFAEAGAYAAELNRRFPGSVDIETLTGDAALLAGEPGAALAAYGAAGEVRRTSAMVQRAVLALRRAGDEAAADRLLAETLTLNPQDRALAVLLGRRHAAQERWDEAALLLGHAARRGGARDPRLFADLAQARLKAGDGEAALAAAQRAYRLQPARPEAAAALAAALAAQGEGGADVLLAKVRRLEDGRTQVRR